MGETFLFGAGEVVVSFVGTGLLLEGKMVRVRSRSNTYIYQYDYTHTTPIPCRHNFSLL